METTTSMHQSEIEPGQLYDALLALRDGDFSARLPADWTNRAGMVARVFNSLAQMLQEFTGETLRLADELGTRGLLGGQAEVFGIYGNWRQMLDALNRMAVGFTVEMRLTSQFAEAAASGKNPAKLQPQFISGEITQMQEHINALAAKLTDRMD